MRNLFVGMVFLFLSAAVNAGVIIQPAGATTTAGENGGQWVVENAINQSGLSAGYTSGVTDFDTYLGTGPTHVVASDNTWFSAGSVTTGFFDLDLGGLQTIQSLALWNESQDAQQGVNEFALYGDVNSDFSTAVLLGNFVATDGLNIAEVFEFAPTAMSFLRIDILSNHGAACCVGIMEVAVESASAGVLYRTSLDDGSNDFSVYDIETNTWTTLTPFPSRAQMATSTDSRLFGWNTTADEIQEYDPLSDTWAFVQAAPPTTSNYGNLEYRANGEWVYTQFTDSIMHYTNGGAWQTTTLPFTANAVGDYDPATDTLVIGQQATSFFHAIDMGTLAITSFTLDADGNGELSRCGQIRNGRFYYETHDNTVRSLDLSDNTAPPVDLDPGDFFESCAVSESTNELFLAPLSGATLRRIFLDDSSTEALAGHTSVGNHSSLTWVGSAEIEVPMADLTISKTDNIDPVTAGTELIYTVRVDNIGTAAADNVVVTDTLPAGVTLVSTAGCTEDPTGVPTCSLGTIAAAGFAEFTVTVMVDPATTGIITNGVSVATSSQESNTDNNSATQDTTVVAEADLSITKMDSSDPIISGGNQILVYTIEVSNAGPSDATNVLVTDTLPSIAEFLSTSGCQNDPVGVPVCQLGTITAGASASYTISVMLQRSGGTIANSASVSSDASDPSGENDSVVETTVVTAIAIPTLNSLGLLMLILLLTGFGWMGIRRT